jgi:hypothetical protein
MAAALALYGDQCFQLNMSRGRYSELINAVVSVRRHWRTMLAEAWDVDRAWQSREISYHHVPMPVQVLKAAVVISLLLGQVEFAFVLLVGFLGGTRPGDLFSLKRNTIILPSDLAEMSCDVFFIFTDPKSRARGGAKTEHVVVSEPEFTAFCEWFCANLSEQQPVWPWTSYHFGKVWEFIILGKIGIPVHGTSGLTPSSLRAGCATEMFRQTHSLSTVRWHLRHASERTLGHYIQEVPLALQRAALSPSSKAVVREFAPLFEHALAACIDGVFGHGLRPARAPLQLMPRPQRFHQRQSRQRNLTRELGSFLTDGGYWHI